MSVVRIFYPPRQYSDLALWYFVEANHCGGITDYYLLFMVTAFTWHNRSQIVHAERVYTMKIVRDSS